MCNKHPKAVVIDGDGAMRGAIKLVFPAMREAIKLVFPEASHRLCAWHLHNNACENVKNPSFLEDCKKAMYCNFTPYQFENFWKNIVVKHGLVGNKWISKTYEKKALWATAYLRDTFFGRIRTASQCEAIKLVIKTYVRKKSTVVEFMQQFEQALMVAIDSVMHPYYRIKDDVARRAIKWWTDLEAARKNLVKTNN